MSDVYKEYSVRGVVKWLIQYKGKPSAVFYMRIHPEYYSCNFCK